MSRQRLYISSVLRLFIALGFSHAFTIVRHSPQAARLMSSALPTFFMTFHNSSLDEVYQRLSSKIVKEDVKSTNLELVTRGQQFGSYKRRFDYSVLFPKEKRSEKNGDSEASLSSSSSHWVKVNNVRSFGIEDTSYMEPIHLKTFVKACARINPMVNTDDERSMSQAVYIDGAIAKILHTQAVIEVQSSTEEETNKSKNHNRTMIAGLSDEQFQRKRSSIEHLRMKSVQGLHVIDACNEIVKAIWNGNIVTEHTWYGNKYITHIYSNSEGGTRTNRVMAVQRQIVPSNGIHGTYMLVDYILQPKDDTLKKKTNILDNMMRYRELYRPSYGTNKENDILTSSPQRVPGCVANVSIQTTLIQVTSIDDAKYRVIIDGDADAILSRGILSVLQDFVSSSEITSDIILNIDPFTFADKMNLRHVLSTGRNDGLASMIGVVQGQIKSLLKIEPEDNQTSNTTVVETKTGRDVIPIEYTTNQKIVKTKGTVAMLLSGGVDSSVALNLLVREGYDVTAFYLKIWLEDELAHLGQCPWEEDYNVCIQVCEQAGVPLEAISLQSEYSDRVISYTVSEAKKGRTPNPDIMCNSRVKFGCFYDVISDRNFDYVATGHYAQLKNEPPFKRLYRAPDPVKDQSYFLAALTQEQLNTVLFPIGKYHKSKVRELAMQFDLPNKSRPDSQGLCFLGKVKFDEFLAAYLGNDPGDIVDTDTDEVIGRHNGIWYHTVGQRKGIGKVLFPLASSKGPWYVVAKDTKRKIIFASNKYDEADFEKTRRIFYVEDVHWIASPPASLSSGVHLAMKIRHGPSIVSGILTSSKDDETGKIVLDKKDGGLAPGQFVAFYKDDECLGSAVISEKHWVKYLDVNNHAVDVTQ